MNDLGSILTALLEMIRLEPVIVLEHAVLIGIGCMGFLVLAFIWQALSDASGFSPVTAVILAICVSALGMMQIGFENLEAIFLTAYVPMAVAIRGAQGAAIGGFARPWHLLILALVTLVVAVFWDRIAQVRLPFHLPPDALPRSALVIGVAAVSSFQVARSFRGSSPMDAPLILVGIFAVFLSVHLYLPHDPTMVFLYRWSFPAGLVLTLVVRATIGLRSRKA